ncbi:hypothetical protein ACVWZM_001862 [Bradyrhizobium sp. USDA 4501]
MKLKLINVARIGSHYMHSNPMAITSHAQFASGFDAMSGGNPSSDSAVEVYPRRIDALLA